MNHIKNSVFPKNNDRKFCKRCPHKLSTAILTNWPSTDEQTTWNVEVVASGRYQVDLYCARPASDVGSKVCLKFNRSRLDFKISQPHDPPLRGQEHDRVERGTTVERYPRLPMGARAVEIPDGAVSNYFLSTFGRATRETVCSCEVQVEPSLSQAFHLINGESTNQRVAEGGIVQAMLEDGKTPRF